jgi:hypothetical protein
MESDQSQHIVQPAKGVFLLQVEPAHALPCGFHRYAQARMRFDFSTSSLPVQELLGAIK